MRNKLALLLTIFALMMFTACADPADTTRSISSTAQSPAPSSIESVAENGAETAVASDEEQNNNESVSIQTSNTPKETPGSESEGDITVSIAVTIGDKAFTAKLYDNNTTRALLEQFPLSLDMSELNGNEKYFYFEQDFPADSQTVGTINSGDLMLYGSDCLVLFYEDLSTSYSYTRLGYIEDTTGLAEALVNGSVHVDFGISQY